VRDAAECDLSDYDHHGLLVVTPHRAAPKREDGFPGHPEDA
jgi:hypothetical protein